MDIHLDDNLHREVIFGYKKPYERPLRWLLDNVDDQLYDHILFLAPNDSLQLIKCSNY